MNFALTLICSQKGPEQLYSCIISVNVLDQKIFNISCFYFPLFICFIHTLIHALIYGKIELSKEFFSGVGWLRWVGVEVSVCCLVPWGPESIYGNFTICLILFIQ